MFSKVVRALGPILCWLAVTTIVRASRAEDQKQACAGAHARGQEERRAGRLKRAQESFAECGGKSCPTIARNECSRWLREVEQEIPTIAIRAVDESGAKVVLERMRIDSNEIDPSLTSEPIALDPGDHVVKAFAAGGREAEATISLEAGQRSAPVRLVLSATKSSVEPEPMPTSRPGPAPDRAESPGVSPWAFVTGGLTVVGLASFTFFGLSGRSKQTDLEDNCAPSCKQSEVDAMRRDYLVANISLGVAVLAGAATVWLVLDRPTKAVAGRSNSSSKVRLGAGARAAPGGFAISAVGAF